jgi:general secretion pathway protein I
VSASRRGFTLLEVMVALALLAAAMMAVSDLAGAALRNHEQARDLNAAVLLARAELAHLEEKYQDQGFKDFDEEESGDFAEEGRPDLRWKAELLRPSPDLDAQRILSMMGLSGDEKDDPGALASRLLGSQAPRGGPTSAAGAPAAATVAQLLQTQLTAFGETLKRSLRELRLTVTWPAGKRTQSFTVVTHLVVLNPRAPGGARGDQPDVPASVAAATAAAAAAQAAAAVGTGAPVPGLPVPKIPGPPKPPPKPWLKGQ